MPGDITGPLLNWASFNTDFDLSAGDGSIVLAASARDDLSGVYRVSFPFVFLTAPDTGSSRLFDLRGFPDSQSDVYSIETHPVSQYMSRGVYALQAVRLDDELGNVTMIQAEQALSMGVPVQLVLHDGGVTVASPTHANDVIVGTHFNDYLRGFDGDDVISGGEGADRLEGGNGNDTLEGGLGSDRIYGGAGLIPRRG
jgi:hypothetical protein